MDINHTRYTLYPIRCTLKAGVIEISPSRCLRMRFEKSRCSKCIDCCPAGAVKIEGGLNIDRDTCTECMLCVAECPSGGLEIPSLNFYSLISRLRKIPHPPKSSLDKGGTEGGYLPVLGCNVQEDSNAHINTFCMGFLSEEHLISLMVFLNTPLQLNLTGCKTCKNSFIVDVLRKRLKLINSKFQIPNRITLIEDRSALQYQEIPCDRRGFFGALKGLAIEGAANFVGSAAEQKKQVPAFGDKVLPFKRKLLNKVLHATPYTLHATPYTLHPNLIKNYYYNLLIDENCDMCFACIGMCPTEAIKSNEESKQEDAPYELLFYSYLCNGCGLCSDFCMQSSISIKQGFSGNPFEEKCVKRVSA